MRFDEQFMGGSVMQSTGFLVCPRCDDPPNYQQSLVILPPDPPSFMNTRPENYYVDETNLLTTDEGDTLVTADDELITTNIPNPTDDAAVTVLTASLTYAGTLTVAYLDLFNGDPTASGTSILATITGSATRTNVFSSLSETGEDVLLNPDVITVESAADALANVSHIGIYSAATGGTLLTSGAVSATYPLIAEGVAVRFDQLGLQIAQS